jgi:hypothetical protein
MNNKNLRCRAVGGKRCLIDEMVVANIQMYGVCITHNARCTTHSIITWRSVLDVQSPKT